MKRFGLSLFCLLFCLMLILAVMPEAPARAAETPSSPALCATAGGADFLLKTGGSCGASFCTSDAQCRANCPSATSATCSSGTCHYTTSGGGSGGSGGQCPQQRFCSTNSQCYYSLGGVQGTCSGGTCHC